MAPEAAPQLAPEMGPEMLEMTLELAPNLEPGAAPSLGVVLALGLEAQHPPLEHVVWAWLSDQLDKVQCGWTLPVVVRPGGLGN